MKKDCRQLGSCQIMTFQTPDGNLLWKLYTFYFSNNWLGCLKNYFRLLIIVPSKCDYISASHKSYQDEVPLPLVIAGSPWLSLVNFDSIICHFVCAFAIIFPVICRNLLQQRGKNCKCANEITNIGIEDTKETKDNQGKSRIYYQQIYESHL